MEKDVFLYCVRTLKDLREKIIPFFEENPLRTAKSRDFEKFKIAIQLMSKNIHLSKEGIERLIALKKS